MKAILACLAAASTVLASEKAFNIHDDLDAFPHYKIVFDPSSISSNEAQTLLSQNVSTQISEDIDGSSYAAQPIPMEHVRIVMPASTQSDVIPPYTIPFTSEAQPYLCSIPRPIQPSHTEEDMERERVASLSEAERANRRGWELLQGMKGQCIYHVKNWWAYEYCYGTPDSMVKQFHPIIEETTGRPKWPLVVDPDQAYFILGRAEPQTDDNAKTKSKKKNDGTQQTLGDEDDEVFDKEKAEIKPGDVDVAGKTSSKSSTIPPGGTLVNKGETTYLTHHLTSGTRCDLTHRHRDIEIQYHCRPELKSDWVAVVREITTCSYLMVIQTPRLCKDPAFQKRLVTDSLEIKCRRISEQTKDDLLREEADRGKQVAAQLAGKTEETGIPRATYRDGKIVIGGTVIGEGKYFPIVKGKEPRLKKPFNWRSTGTKTDPDGELFHGEEATQTPSGKFKLDKPTVGGRNVGVADKDSRVVEMSSVKRDHPDVKYTVVASGIIGSSSWEVLDEKILKAFKLGPDEIGLILQDVDWKSDSTRLDGQRWYLVVLTGPKVEKGLEIRAVVETKVEEKETVEETVPEKKDDGRIDEKAEEKVPEEERERVEAKAGDKVDGKIKEVREEVHEEKKMKEPEPEKPEHHNAGERRDETAEGENLGGSEEEMIKDEL